MGIIHSDIRDKHLIEYPNEKELVTPFLSGFDITWARKRKASNTELSVYLLKPEYHISEAYGISQEILMIYSPYMHMESRTIQAAESFLTDSPAKGRVESLIFFLISDDLKVNEWVETYISENPESRLIVAFSASELRRNKGDGYYIRKVLNKFLYERDLFDYRLPLEKDHYFFGRKDIISNIYDSLKKGENSGLFGLRKTGKTSILYKIERQMNMDNLGSFYYYDCKLPSIRKLSWNKFLEKICRDISQRLSIEIEEKFEETEISETFSKIIEKSQGKGRIVLVFDEIEYISPIAMDNHWKSDFVSFWQTFWGVQSRQRNVSAIIGGVNPYPLEMDTINGIQNPLFGIVSYRYLKGLNLEDIKLMIKGLGRKMGLNFDHTAIEYLYERYGGHPLLTRIACSLINNSVVSLKENKPVLINSQKIINEFEESLDSNLTFYYRHVVSELKEFYIEEYDLLEMLSSGQRKEFVEETRYQEKIKHLSGYGLISYDENKMPKISIPAVGRYIGFEYMRREGRKTIYKVIEKEHRSLWLSNIKKSILSDLRQLENLLQHKKLPSLFGPNSFPEADEFVNINIATDKAIYGDFINVCYRCFVESIDNYGKSIGKNKYFWDEIKKSYPALWDALYRIRLYRHAFNHRQLNEKPNEDFYKYLNKDLEGQSYDKIKEVNFVVEQCVLEGLLTGIQIETYNLSEE